MIIKKFLYFQNERSFIKLYFNLNIKYSDENYETIKKIKEKIFDNDKKFDYYKKRIKYK